MATDVTITVFNETRLSDLKIYIFSEQFSEAPLNSERAWKVIDAFEPSVMPVVAFPSGSMVRAAWEPGNMLSSPLIVSGDHRGFKVIQTPETIALEAAANPPSASEIAVTSDADLEGGVTAYLLKDGDIYLRSGALAKGQTAAFNPNEKLYWSVSHAGAPLSPVTELDVAGLQSVDWTLTLDGDAYKFTASNVTSAS